MVARLAFTTLFVGSFKKQKHDYPKRRYVVDTDFFGYPLCFYEVVLVII